MLLLRGSEGIIKEADRMITLTQNAIQKLKEILDVEAEAKGKSLRISLQKGGCSGYEYGFAFDNKKEGDSEVVADGARVLIDPESAKFLANSVIDYAEEATSAGFKIQNPNVKSSCGCGTSHQF